MNILATVMNMNSMSASNNMKHKRHLFICTNDRDDKSIKTCGSIQITESHLVNGFPVERLRLHFNKVK